MHLVSVLANVSRKPSEFVSVLMAVCLLVVSVAPSFAQAGREDVQLQILMVKSPGRNFDPKGQLLTFQVTDKSGTPVVGAEIQATLRNGEFTDEEGRPQGATITYFTDEQGRAEFRVRRNKAGGFVAINLSASSLNRTAVVKNFNLQFPSAPLGLSLKVATILAVAGAGTVGAIVAAKAPSRPGAPSATQIIVGTPTIRR
jgi:hypothetical protein